MIIQKAQRLNALKEYYFSVKLAEIRQMIAEGKPVINLGIGSPDLAPSPEAIGILCEAAQRPNTHAYQPYKGIALLRQAMSRFYEQYYSVSLRPDEEILPLMGSKEGITHISLAFLDPGDEVLVPELGYPAYAAVSQMTGAHVRYYSLQADNGWQPDLAELEAMDMSRVKLMWLNYPHMPTGAPAQAATLKALVALAQRKKILICHDNPYSLVLNDEPPLSILSFEGAMEVAIELNSMSKSHNMAGWRIGWLAGAKAYIDAVLTIKSNVDSGMFMPLQAAAAEALLTSPEWHVARNDIYRQRRKLAQALLDALHCTYDNRQTGMFLWARIPARYADAGALVDELLYQQNIFITPGFIFGEKGNNYVRISLCCPETLLQQALERVNAAY